MRFLEKICRHTAASFAQGRYWRIGVDCFKQEERSDGFSVFLFYVEQEWWITSHPAMPALDSPWIARASPRSNCSYLHLDKLEWRCPVWDRDVNPSLWVKSAYISLEEERLQQISDSVTLVEQRQAALDIKQAELERVSAEYEELKGEILLPKQKPKDFMHTPVGKTPPKPKTGWFNKMLDLLSAFHSGEDKVVEALITQCPVLVIRLVSLSSTFVLCFPKRSISMCHNVASRYSSDQYTQPLLQRRMGEVMSIDEQDAACSSASSSAAKKVRT